MFSRAASEVVAPNLTADMVALVVTFVVVVGAVVVVNWAGGSI